MPAPAARHDKAALTTSGAWVALGTAPSTAPPRALVVGLLSVANNGASDVMIDVAIGTAATPAAADIVVNGITVSTVDEYEKRPLVCGPGEQIRVRATGTGTIAVAAHAFGEESDV